MHGKTLGVEDYTNSDGEYELFIDSDLSLDPERSPVTLRVLYEELSFHKELSASDWEAPKPIVIGEIPVSGKVVIEHQPLRQSTSIATLDLIIYNSSHVDAEIGQIDLALQTTQKDCAERDRAVDEVGRVLIVDAGANQSITADINPIASEIEQHFFNDYLCADIVLHQKFTIKANSNKRIRLDVVSADVREIFNQYASGMGPYTDYSKETGTVYRKSDWLEKPALRYYNIEVVIHFIAPTKGYPTGTFTNYANMTPGSFPNDLSTVTTGTR